MNGSTTEKLNNRDELYVRHNGLHDLIVIAMLIAVLIFYWYASTDALNVAVMGLYFACTYTQLKEKRYGCFFFYATFFLFLLDTVFFGIFDKAAKYKFLSSEIENHVLLSLAVSMVGIYIGAVFKLNYHFIWREERRENHTEKRSHSVSRNMQAFLKWLFVFCGLFSIIDAVVKAVFVSGTSYLAYYSEFETPLPYYIRWLSSISSIVFFFYLGTQPSRKDVRMPLIIYLLVGAISLFMGQRNVIVVRTIVVLCYLLIRNKYASNGEEWITRWQIISIVLLIPVAIIFMGFWGSFRNGQAYSGTGVWESIRSALLDQGNNIQILDLEYRYGDVLPDKKYAIGGIISFIHNNIFGRILGLEQIPTRMHTTEIITEGYSFEAALMAVEAKSAFLLGYGMGSCYIAELIHSFGMIGMFIGSVVYGVVLRKLNEVKLNSFIANGFALYMFQRLLMAPRATFDGFIAGTFQIANLFIALLCWLLSKYVWPEKEYEEYPYHLNG